MANQILTPEEKLKNLRKRFGLKQHEITDGQITRNLISMIENGKARLTHENGIKIVEKINKILKNRSIEIVVSPEEILETIEDQIENISVDYLEKFNKAPNETLAKEINTFLTNKKYTHTKFQLYKNIGNFYYNNSNFHCAITFYSKIYDLSVKYETGTALYELIANYTDSLMKLMRFSEVFNLIKISDQFSSNMSKEQKSNLTLVKLRALVMIEKYEQALKILKNSAELKTNLNTSFKKLYLLWLETFLNIKLNNMSEAKKVIKRANNSKNKSNNIIGKTAFALIYRTDSNIEDLKEITTEIESSLSDIDDSEFLNFLYGYLGKFYLKLENFKKSEIYFRKVLDFEEKIFDLNMKYSSISNLVDLYSISNQFEKTDEFEKIAVKWFNMSYLKNSDPLFMKLIYIYSKSNSMEKIKKLLNEIEINDNF